LWLRREPLLVTLLVACFPAVRKCVDLLVHQDPGDQRQDDDVPNPRPDCAPETPGLGI
jgi:hypothetical protein